MTHAKRFIGFGLLLALLISALAACGGGAPATMNDIPTLPGATALDPNITKTLAQNMQQDAAMRQAVGAGGKIEQKGYSVPKDTQWDAVKSFYAEKLKGAGWETNSMVSNIMAQANAMNSMYQTETWKKGAQTLTVILLGDPVNGDKNLLLSLNTN